MAEKEKENGGAGQQFERQFFEFIGSLEFGTTQYQAVSDYLHLKGLEEDLRIEQKNAASKNSGTESKTHWESQSRIAEQEIALLRLQVYNNRSRVEGYDDAYTHIGIVLEFNLFDAARDDAKSLFAADQQQSTYVSNFYNRIFSDAAEIVMTKRK